MKNNSKFYRLLAALPAILLLASAFAQAAETMRVSVRSNGSQLGAGGTPTAISADGRFVMFNSSGYLVVPGDTNKSWDAFIHDRLTGKTTRVSISSTGEQGNANSGSTAISADGRFVAFDSIADNLVAGDTNGSTDAFVHDRLTGKTTRVSVSSTGEQGNNNSYPRAISADGRFVAIYSWANNLVAGDTNEAEDAFVHDRLTGKTTRVSVSSTGEQGNRTDYSYPRAISADGRFVAFDSYADNLVDDDTNNYRDVFVHDRLSGKTERVSVSSTGEQGNDYSLAAAISADGRFVGFYSGADNLVAGGTNPRGVYDAFVRDRLTGKTERVSVSSAGEQGNRGSWTTAISADGRFVAFDSYADNLVDNDRNRKIDAFVRDRLTGKTERISVGSYGDMYYSGSASTAISADGRFVLFGSDASLVAGDTNEGQDAFVRDRLLNTAKAADLQAAVIAQPAVVPKGQTASYTLTVTNAGPDSADFVTLTDIVSKGTVTGITSSQGSCSKATVSVCRLGALAAGASATVDVDIKAISNPLKQQVSVSAAPKDNAPDNNALKISTLVTP